MRKRPIFEGILKAYPPIPLESSINDMLKAFWPLDRLLDDLRSGEVAFAGMTPVMIDHDGSYGEIVPSLTGWSSCMERIAKRLSIPLDLSLLVRIAKRLEAGVLLDQADIDRTAYLVDRCRAIFMACPVRIRKACTVDELIEIAVEDYGLRRAA